MAESRLHPIAFAGLALGWPPGLWRRLRQYPPDSTAAVYRLTWPLLVFAALTHGVMLELLRPEPQGWLSPQVLGPVARILVLGGFGLWLGGWLCTRLSALAGYSDREEGGLMVAAIGLVPMLLALVFNPLPLPWGRMVLVAGFVWALALMWRADGLFLGLPRGSRGTHLLCVVVALTVALVAVGWPVTAVIPGAW